MLNLKILSLSLSLSLGGDCGSTVGLVGCDLSGSELQFGYWWQWLSFDALVFGVVGFVVLKVVVVGFWCFNLDLVFQWWWLVGLVFRWLVGFGVSFFLIWLVSVF